MFTQDKPKRVWASRLFMHHLPIFITELIIIIISLYYASNLPRIFYWPLVAIMSCLCFDMLHIIRNCVVGDLHKSLKYDARWRLNSPPALIQDYRYYAEQLAYAKYNRYRNPSCAICQYEFDKEPLHFGPSNKCLLQCGHAYHHSCLQGYERYKWNNDNWPYPFCKCPLCKRGYNIDTEKFNFNINYYNEKPWYYKQCQYPGKSLMKKYLWGPVLNEYKSYYRRTWKQYPQKWNTNYFCEC